MTDCIWLSNVYGESMSGRGFFPFSADKRGNGTTTADLGAIKRAERGEFLAPEEVPPDFFSLSDSAAHRKAPLHIFTNGFLIITEESATVLRQFDLGECRLHPVRLWHPDRKTRFGTGHYVLNFASRKDAFLPDRSPLARYEAYINRPESAKGKPGFWMLPPNEGDDQLVFSKAVLDGPDLWWEPSFFNLFFLSHRLAQALKAAKLAKHWRLFRCPVV
jgi:hypothetical protein